MTRTLACILAGLASTLVATSARAQALEPPAGGGAAPPANPAINESEEGKDSGLGLEWVYLNGDVGGGFASMDSFNQTTLGLQKTSSGGPAFGVGAGIRLLFFSIGARVRDLQLSGIGDLWELNGEAAFHVKVGHVDGYFGARGGYNFVGSLNSQTAAVATGDTPGNVSVHGFNVGPMLGLDVYFNKWISIGVDADVQFLFLQRPKLTIPGPEGTALSAECSSNSQCSNLYNESGSSAGIAFVPTAHLGIHF
ncbi:MAG TPA: hypothetical protein VGG39_28680 [Polyangiaceae bacterium]|jgi:hypothetical protein